MGSPIRSLTSRSRRALRGEPAQGDGPGHRPTPSTPLRRTLPGWRNRLGDLALPTTRAEAITGLDFPGLPLSMQIGRDLVLGRAAEASRSPTTGATNRSTELMTPTPTTSGAPRGDRPDLCGLRPRAVHRPRLSSQRSQEHPRALPFCHRSRGKPPISGGVSLGLYWCATPGAVRVPAAGGKDGAGCG